MGQNELVWMVKNHPRDKVHDMFHKDMIVLNCCLMRIANPALTPPEALEEVLAIYHQVDKAFEEAELSRGATPHR